MADDDKRGGVMTIYQVNYYQQTAELNGRHKDWIGEMSLPS